jgi:hypothetical protein
MWYLTEDNQLVNLTNMDAIIIRKRPYSDEDYQVVAIGQSGGFWAQEEMEIRNEFILFQSSGEEDCIQVFEEIVNNLL